MKSFRDKFDFIWSVAALLRGDYKTSEYGRIDAARGASGRR
jgi:hypothetical protein